MENYRTGVLVSTLTGITWAAVLQWLNVSKHWPWGLRSFITVNIILVFVAIYIVSFVTQPIPKRVQLPDLSPAAAKAVAVTKGLILGFGTWWKTVVWPTLKTVGGKMLVLAKKLANWIETLAVPWIYAKARTSSPWIKKNLGYIGFTVFGFWAYCLYDNRPIFNLKTKELMLHALFFWALVVAAFAMLAYQNKTFRELVVRFLEWLAELVSDPIKAMYKRFDEKTATLGKFVGWAFCSIVPIGFVSWLWSGQIEGQRFSFRWFVDLFQGTILLVGVSLVAVILMMLFAPVWAKKPVATGTAPAAAH